MNHVQQTLLASGTTLSTVKLCHWLGLPRATAYYQPRQRSARGLYEALVARIRRLHQEEPNCGVRGTWSRLRFRDGLQVNRKKVLEASLQGRCAEQYKNKQHAEPAGQNPEKINLKLFQTSGASQRVLTYAIHL